MAVTRAFHRWVASRRLKRLDQLEKAITIYRLAGDQRVVYDLLNQADRLKGKLGI